MTTNKKSPASSTQKTTNKNAKTTTVNKNTSKTNTVLNTQGSFQGSSNNNNNSNSNSNNNTTNKAQAQQPLQPTPNITGTSYFSTSSLPINKEQIKTLNTREYIQATVMQDVSEGMYLIAKDKPLNPIEYLGKYLLEQSKLKEK
jgi:hypothetical protein